jgi:protein TonB
VSKPEASTAAPPAPAPAPPPAPKPVVDVDQLRQNYVARILAHVEPHKFYPRMARRRDIQGEVRLTINVDCQGGLLSHESGGAHKLLENSATKALAQALPLPTPPDELGCPLHIEFGMVYSLQ